MPNVAGVRKLLPVKLISRDWQHCGAKGITLRKAEGDSVWLLHAVCNSCKVKLLINKRGVWVLVP